MVIYSVHRTLTQIPELFMNTIQDGGVLQPRILAMRILSCTCTIVVYLYGARAAPEPCTTQTGVLRVLKFGQRGHLGEPLTKLLKHLQ